MTGAGTPTGGAAAVGRWCADHGLQPVANQFCASNSPAADGAAVIEGERAIGTRVSRTRGKRTPLSWRAWCPHSRTAQGSALERARAWHKSAKLRPGHRRLSIHLLGAAHEGGELGIEAGGHPRRTASGRCPGRPRAWRPGSSWRCIRRRSSSSSCPPSRALPAPEA